MNHQFVLSWSCSSAGLETLTIFLHVPSLWREEMANFEKYLLQPFLYLIGLCIPNVKAESLLGIIGLNLALDLVNSCYGGWPIWCRLGQESMSIGDPIIATMVRGGFKNHWKYSCPKLGKLRIIMIIKKLKSACSTIPLQQLYDLSTQWQKVGILVYLCSYRWV